MSHLPTCVIDSDIQPQYHELIGRKGICALNCAGPHVRAWRTADGNAVHHACENENHFCCIDMTDGPLLCDDGVFCSCFLQVIL